MRSRSLAAAGITAVALAIAACTGAKPAGSNTPAIDVPSASPSASAPPAPSGSSTAGVECATDSDCGGATCCHPRACVPISQQPSCAGSMCTMECRGGTLDCGGGSCLCQNGKCGIVLRDRRKLPPSP